MPRQMARLATMQMIPQQLVSDDDAKPKKAARGRGRGRRVARNDGGENDRDEPSQTEPSKASGDPAPDAAADPASPDGDAAVK